MSNMSKITCLLSALALLFAFGFAGHASAEDDAEMFFMVKRIWVPDVQSLVTEELDLAHQDHIAEYSNSVMSSRLMNREGDAIGVISIKTYKSWEDVEFYVYEDPYTKAGLYSDITIERIDMYVLNATYARAPDWYKERFPDRAAAYTVPTVPAQ